MLEIRTEIARDFEAIREINRVAFGGDAEARLIDLLRAGGLVIASLWLLAGIGEEPRVRVLLRRLHGA